MTAFLPSLVLLATCTGDGGIWLSRDEIRALPTSGPAWEQVRHAADRDVGRPELRDQNLKNDVYTLAKALVWVRTGAERYRDEVRANCLAAMGTEMEGRTLALGRNLVSYVIAADLVGLEPEEDERFRRWLRRVLDEELGGRTLRSTHEDRPNNWGAHAGASRAAVAAYLDDRAELERTAVVLKGWLGDRESYAGFKYGELDWQADPERPVGINPAGSTKNGFSVDGLIPDDMRRGGGFGFPPGKTNYPWGALEGATVAAEILWRQGYDAWEWEDRALLRAVQALHDLDRAAPDDEWWAHGDDEWNVWLVNHVYGTDFPAALPGEPGKNMGWTDWTHAGKR